MSSILKVVISFCRHLNKPSPPFEMITMVDLVPEDRRDAYAEAGGDVF